MCTVPVRLRQDLGNISFIRSFSNAETYWVTARRMLATLTRAISGASIVGLRNSGSIDTFLEYQFFQEQNVNNGLG